MHDVILREGRFVTPSGTIEGDLAVEDGRIVELGTVRGSGREEIRLEGRWTLPGVVDPHVHFRTPGYTHKETWITATRSALAGGVTSVVDMPNTDPTTTDAAALAEKLAHVASEARCSYGFFVGATPHNLDALRRLEDMDLPYCGIKVFMGSSTGRLLVDDPEGLRSIFRDTRKIIALHAEDNEILMASKARYRDAESATVHGLARPVEAAIKAVRNVLELSDAHDHPAHICHMSTAAELELVLGDAGHGSGRVSVEVCPHHLAFEEGRCATHGNLAKMNPPLRPERDRQALWNGLARGDVAFVATDHAPHLLDEKEQPYPSAPSGIPGVETSLRYMLYAGPRHGLDMSDVARVMSQGAADRFGIVGKGRIAVGWDGDLVVASDGPGRPFERSEVLSHCGWSLFEGEVLAPPPAMVLVGGKVAARGGRIVDDDVRGRPLVFAEPG